MQHPSVDNGVGRWTFFPKVVGCPTGEGRIAAVSSPESPDRRGFWRVSWVWERRKACRDLAGVQHAADCQRARIPEFDVCLPLRRYSKSE
ncbi:hypothetical protein GYB59_01005 [bacterium]|nr:hypothetical protein [bacterium]